MWSIVQLGSMLKLILNTLDRLDRVQYVTKTMLDNNVTNRINLMFVETKIKLLGPI